MRMTNQKLIETINEVYAIQGKNLPVKLGYAIGRTMYNLEAVYNAYDKQRIKLLDKYAEKDAEGNNLMEEQIVTDAQGKEHKTKDLVFTDKKAWKSELDSLLELEVEISTYDIDFSALEYDTDKYDKLSVKDLKALCFMVHDNEPNENPAAKPKTVRKK